jgi:hypothetical protein
MAFSFFRLSNPNSGTKTLTATFVGGAETNVVVHAAVFRDSAFIGSIGNSLETVGASSTSFTLTQEINYQLPMLFTNSFTATHTAGSSQIPVYNSNNNYGTDSFSYFGELPVFTSQTNFNVAEPERITTLTDFDIDLLVGTEMPNSNMARVLRWDTENESWFAEDSIEEGTINAFIRDDNNMFVQAGDFGRMFFYNGEQLIPFKNLGGEFSPTRKIKVNQKAVTTLLGIPRFGLSNIEGNPVPQGVYTFGSYSKDYPKVLDLSFPVSSGELEGVEIGSIVSRGADMYVSWKDGENVGIDKIDYSNKFEDAFIETTQLTSADQRINLTNIGKIYANYVSLPEDTGITMAINKNYANDFTNLNVINDTNRKQIRMENVITDINSLQLRVGFVVDGNNAPEVESIVI